MFHIVSPVHEIHSDWRTLWRREILRCSRPIHWLKLRDFRICASNHCITNNERSHLVVNCLKGVALKSYLKETNPKMPHQMVVDRLRERYYTPHRKLSLQSEVYSLSVNDFMVRHQIQDEKECLRRMVVYLNEITPQLVNGFHTESNKIENLSNTVFGIKWENAPLKNF